MNPKGQWTLQVDKAGNLIVPAELASRFGLQPGARLKLEEGPNELRLLRPVTHLAKVYIEPTNICNLDCRTCMRNVWDEAYGKMDWAVFERILDGIAWVQPRPTVFFGGFGEPLAHPRIAEMITRVKGLGCSVEMISNGILLNEERGMALLQADLDRLWISLDGASPESYSDVRLGASLPKVIANLERLRELRCLAGYRHDHRPWLGIAFVAMQRNIRDLPAVLSLGTTLGAKFFSISNVLAHTEELNQETLYQRSMGNHATLRDTQHAVINLPRMDWNDLTAGPLAEVHRRKHVMLMAGKEMNRAHDSCTFIEQGSTAIRWDGAVSPCLPLLHSNEYYLAHYLRRAQEHVIGFVGERDLLDLWQDPEYVAFRERVQQFDFSPCAGCSGCELSQANHADCMDSPAPTCGGCLWGQGLIQCP